MISTEEMPVVSQVFVDLKKDPYATFYSIKVGFAAEIGRPYGDKNGSDKISYKGRAVKLVDKEHNETAFGHVLSVSRDSGKRPFTAATVKWFMPKSGEVYEDNGKPLVP
jgi:hypothetical protein